MVHADYVRLHHLPQVLVHHAEHLHDLEHVQLFVRQAQIVAQALEVRTR